MISVEENLKQHIITKYGKIKTFSSKCGIPYTTVMMMFERSVPGASARNIVKICRELNIDVDRLIEDGVIVDKPINDLSDEERALVLAYRAKPELHSAVDKLLDL